MHPHNDWTRERLESYIGTTEALKLEFKSYGALLAVKGKTSQAERMAEAARDVAAMANEQGGHIIYGIEESGKETWQTAIAIQGFSREHKPVSREWLSQFLQDQMQPPLTSLDVAHVPLGNDEFALVVIVPQAIGSARQTADGRYWRRHAQGLRYMSNQEIEDVRTRTVRPRLELQAIVRQVVDLDIKAKVHVQFRVLNPSLATSSFAVLSVGATESQGVILQPQVRTGWEWFEVDGSWKTARFVMASGSWRTWSPLTPGFVAAPEPIVFTLDLRRPIQTAIGIVRLDHEGGAAFYYLAPPTLSEIGAALETELDSADLARKLFGSPLIPEHLLPPPQGALAVVGSRPEAWPGGLST